LEKLSALINHELDLLFNKSDLPFSISDFTRPIKLKIILDHYSNPNHPRVVVTQNKTSDTQTIAITLDMDEDNRFRHIQTSESIKLFEDSLRLALTKIETRRDLQTATASGNEKNVAQILFTLLDKSFVTKQLRKAQNCHTIDDLQVYLANSIFKALDTPQIKNFLITLIKQIMFNTATAFHQAGVNPEKIQNILSSHFDEIISLKFNRSHDPITQTSVSRYLIDRNSDVASRSAMIESLKQKIISDILSQLP